MAPDLVCHQTPGRFYRAVPDPLQPGPPGLTPDDTRDRRPVGGRRRTIDRPGRRPAGGRRAVPVPGPPSPVQPGGPAAAIHAILATVGTDGDVFPHVGLGAKLRA